MICLCLFSQANGLKAQRRLPAYEFQEGFDLQALQSGPEEDPESQGSGGCDWCGGILIAWAAPPFVRDITPEAHAAFSEPVHPGDVLTQVDDADVRGMGRKATLELLAAMKQSITFMAASRHRFMQSVALRAPEDEESWIGGLLIHWTSPPVVKEVYPEFQGFYEQPVSQGDRLASVHGTDVEGMDRAAILGLLSIYPESFSLRFLTAHLLRMHEDAAMALEPSTVLVKTAVGFSWDQYTRDYGRRSSKKGLRV